MHADAVLRAVARARPDQAVLPLETGGAVTGVVVGREQLSAGQTRPAARTS